MFQGGEPSEQHCKLVEGPRALRPDEGISHQETGDNNWKRLITILKSVSPTYQKVKVDPVGSRWACNANVTKPAAV